MSRDRYKGRKTDGYVTVGEGETGKRQRGRRSPRASSRLVANSAGHDRTRDLVSELGVGMLCSQS